MKLRLATLGLMLLLWVAPARAISRGVLVLLIPPVGFMTLGVGMAFRYGKKRDEDLGRT